MYSEQGANETGVSEAALRIDLTQRFPLIDAGEAYLRVESFYEQAVKPVLDFVFALLLTIVLLPLILACAAAVWVAMGDPILLRQERVGRGGRIFTLYKFRTMEEDRRVAQLPFAGPDRRRTHKTPEDPRITRLGAFMRKWSLDELPQFLNVLKGDMSLVGPRPELVDIVARYEPWQHRRHAVKPGITGLWQISERGNKLLHECTESDIAYIEALTAWTDFRILLSTPLAALGLRRGF